MKKTLTRQAKLNAFSSYLNFAITSIISFFISPLLVNLLGNYYFGIWKLCQKYLDFATVADGRASQALKWIVANHEGKGKSEKEKKQAVGSALYVWLYFLPLLLIIVGGIVFYLPHSVKELQFSDIPVIQMVGIILGLNIVFNPLFGIPDAVLVGINESHKSNNTQTFWIVFSNAGMLLAAYWGYGIVGMALAVFISAILKGISVLIICKLNTPWFGFQKPEKSQTKSFFNFSVWILIWSFVQRLLSSTEILIIGYFLGAQIVSNYVFSSFIIQFGVAFALMSGSAVMPGLGKMFGQKDFIKVREIIHMVREIVLLIAVLFGVLVLSSNEAFVRLWVGQEFYIGNLNNLLMVILMIQLTLLKVEGQIQDISLKVKNKVLWGLTGALLSIIFAALIYLLFWSTISGVLVGIILGRIVINFIFPYLVNTITNNQKKQYNIYILALLFLIGSYFLSPYFISSNWVYLILKITVLITFATLLGYVTLLSHETKSFLRRKILKK